MKTKTKQWASIRNKQCRRCELWEDAQSVCLIGRGDLNADLMLVGEAPGLREDDVNKPFAGRAGHLLDVIIEGLGLTREGLYITNVVRCHPPENRTPFPSELKACRAYTEKEITLVNPKIIIALGGTAATTLLPQLKGQPVKAIHGRMYRLHRKGYPLVFPTYHPAAYYHSHDDSLIDIIVEDFETALDYEEGNRATRYFLIRTPQEAKVALATLEPKSPLVVDVETTSLRWFDPSEKLKLVGLTDREARAFSFVFTPEMQPLLRACFEGRTLIGHNFKSDMKWLRRAKLLPKKFKPWCTLIALHLIDENSTRKDLESGALRYTDMQPWKLSTEEVVDPDTPLRKLARYNCQDVDADMRLYHVLCKLLKEQDLEQIMVHMMRALWMIDRGEWHGIGIDEKALKRLDHELANEVRRLEKQMVSIAASKNFELDVTSRQSIMDLVFRRLRLPVVKRTPKKQAPSLDKEAKAELEGLDKSGFIATFREWESTRKTYSTYVQSMPDYICPGGRVHPRYNLAKYIPPGGKKQKGTVTGRPTCTEPPLQTMPRKGPVKTLFVSRWDGGYLVDADYSQMELRVMTFYARDPDMMEAFSRGDIDFHRFIAAEVAGIPEELVNPDQRKAAKTINFGIIYGQTAFGLAHTLNTSVRKAQAFLDHWFERFPRVAVHLAERTQYIIREQQVVSPMGRVRHLPGASEDTAYGRAKIREGINAPVQSLASDICLFAMWLLACKFVQRGIKAIPVGNIYDSILTDCASRREADNALEIMRDVMVNPPLEKYYGWTFDIPLAVNFKVGKSWGTVKEVESG